MSAAKTCTGCGVEKAVEEFSRNRSNRDGLETRCRECRAEQTRRYREENAEQIRERNRRYYEENAEQIRERNRCYSSDREVRERRRRYREENAEQMRESGRRYYEDNAAAVRERQRRYREENADRSVEEIEADRARLLPGGSKVCRSCRLTLPFEDFPANVRRPDGLRDSCRNCGAQAKALRRRAAYLTSWQARDVWECWICGGDSFEESGPLALNVEHVLPLTRGGPDNPALTRPAHARCNFWKGTRDAVEVLDEIRPDLLERLSLPTG